MSFQVNINSQIAVYADFASFPATGLVKTIYIAKDTNTAYYWNDTTLSFEQLGGATAGAVWGAITGNIADQTDLINALNNKVDKVTGKGLSTNDYTTAEKNKLAGIQAGAEVNVNADWNATSGDAVILNKPTIPTAVTKTSDLTNDGADGINPFITANDIPAFASADKMVTVGRNSTGQTLYKGTIVYISGSTGNRPNFVKSQANGESTSAGTFGVIENDIPNNSDGNCVTIGTIDNLDTRSNATHPFTNDTLADGDTIYLSPTTAGFITNVKPSAPNHLVYVGKVVRTSPTNGTIVYRIQNGYELDEIHDVTTTNYTSPQDVDSVLILDNAASLWKRLTWANIKSTLKTYFDTLYQNKLTLTTTGTSGAATLVGATLNIPQYSGGGASGVHSLIKLNSGDVTSCSVTATTINSTSGVANRMFALPYIPSQTFTSSNLFINVGTGAVSTNARILIYSDLNGKPDQKLYESANLDCSTTGQKTASISFTFTAGTTYWLVLHSSFTNSFAAFAVGSLLTIRHLVTTPISGYSGVATFGSAPTTFPSIIVLTSTVPAVFITAA